MRPSLCLACLGLFGNFAYGFSSPSILPVSSSAAPTTHRRPLLTAAASSFPSIRTFPSSSSSSFNAMNSSLATTTRGGASKASNVSDNEEKSGGGLANTVFSLWGTGGVVYILLKAIKRVLPIALEPFQESSPAPLSQVQLGIYIATCLWFAYVEGYKGFQTKFAPLVVARSRTLQFGSSSSSVLHLLLAPLYSMGLFHATKKRMTVSWSVTLGVAAIVAAVKRLPFPWRNIVDAGVVAGLSWGTVSIVILYLKALVTNTSPPNVDPALPKKD